MAQQRRGQKRPASGNRKTTSGRKKAAPQPQTEQGGQLWESFKRSRLFNPVMTFVVIASVTLLDMLLAWNNYDRFFFILGIELLLIALAWLIGLVLSIGNSPAPGGE